MRVKCISDCSGDYWFLTIGKEYDVVEIIEDYLLYIIGGQRVTEERYRIVDDNNNKYPYPKYCFEVVNN